jgi:hypothetical protein
MFKYINAADEGLPVCERFILLSSNIRAMTSPSRASTALWYFHICSNLAASWHSGPLGAHQSAISICTSKTCTVLRSLSRFLRACQQRVSMAHVLSLTPGVLAVQMLETLAQSDLENIGIKLKHDDHATLTRWPTG